LLQINSLGNYTHSLVKQESHAPLLLYLGLLLSNKDSTQVLSVIGCCSLLSSGSTCSKPIRFA